ncbi:MAG TPA: tetratricopeptide repeat protein [Hyphomonadaceae bacterium]|nr:tetratricopeptide repeat protein [Hyphomonadaceae bacterium]
MSTRFRLGISALTAGFALSFTTPAHAAITVIGGGLARDCYMAVEYQKVSTQRALDICSLAIEQESMTRRNRAATYTNRGILQMRAGHNDKALSDYQRSLAIMPELDEAKVNLGAALYGLKRYPEALAALNDGVRTESLDARAVGYYNRGLTYEKLGDLQSAYEDFQRALQVKPDFKQAADQIGRFTVIERES